MEKKTCIITGGNSGIGKAAAIQIASKGYHVIIGCRNQERGKTAVADIKAESNSDAVEMLLIDLASRKSITDAAKQINEKFTSIDVLIHNAADFDLSIKAPVFTSDGIETIWATNHIGPVLLTDLVLGKINSSKNGRIICIASKGLVMYPKLIVDLEDPEFKKNKFSVSKAYYQSKLAQVMYTYWMAEELRDTTTTINCIRVTNVKVDISRYPNLSNASKIAYSLKSKFSISTEKMAEAYTFLSTDENLDSVSGKYFDEHMKSVKSSKYSMHPKNIDKVKTLTKMYI